MKISEVLELAIARTYGDDTVNEDLAPFMCHAVSALHRMNLINKTDHATTSDFLNDLVYSISPAYQSLWAALMDIQKIQRDLELSQVFPYLLQFYIWVIFDLKRKNQ